VSDLGLVHGHNHDENANTKPTNSSTGIEEGQVLSGCLQGSTDAENNGTNHDCQSSAQPVTHGTSRESSEEATASKEGHNGTAGRWSAKKDDIYVNKHAYTSSAFGLKDDLKEVEATLPPITPRS